MKKVPILEGSPRIKGNSSILSDEFEKGAVEAGCKVEKSHITKQKIAGCLPPYCKRMKLIFRRKIIYKFP